MVGFLITLRFQRTNVKAASKITHNSNTLQLLKHVQNNQSWYTPHFLKFFYYICEVHKDL